MEVHGMVSEVLRYLKSFKFGAEVGTPAANW
jgi:hypothetical protein